MYYVVRRVEMLIVLAHRIKSLCGPVRPDDVAAVVRVKGSNRVCLNTERTPQARLPTGTGRGVAVDLKAPVNSPGFCEISFGT